MTNRTGRTTLTLRRREALVGLAFFAPQFIGFLVFVGAPLLAILVLGFFDWNILMGTLRFTGTANYERMLANEEVAHVARTTILFVIGYVPLTTGVGLALALALNQSNRVNVAIRSFYFLPVVLSLAAWSIAWRLILQEQGLLNSMIQLVAGTRGINWLREPDVALVMVIVVQSLKTVGYSMVLFLAGLQTVPRELREAAVIDGASGRQVVTKIVLPTIAPFTFMVVTLLTISSFKTFALISVLTQGGPGLATTTAAFYIYQQGLQLFDMGYASAVSTVFFAAVLGLTTLWFFLRRRWVDEDE